MRFLALALLLLPSLVAAQERSTTKITYGARDCDTVTPGSVGEFCIDTDNSMNMLWVSSDTNSGGMVRVTTVETGVRISSEASPATPTQSTYFTAISTGVTLRAGPVSARCLLTITTGGGAETFHVKINAATDGDQGVVHSRKTASNDVGFFAVETVWTASEGHQAINCMVDDDAGSQGVIDAISLVINQN